MRKATSVQDLVSGYGQDWRPGILIDHIDLVAPLGGRVHRTASGSTWVTYGKAAAVRVVCGDLIHIWTEDGRMDGRCGLPVVGDRGACAAHADERDAFLASSEAERAAAERVADLW